MSWDRIQAETEALQSLVQMYEQAKHCKQLFERAHMQPPEPLRRFLDIQPPEQRTPSPVARLTVEIPRPQHRRPDQATDDWAWVHMKECRPMILVPAIIENDQKPLGTPEIIERVQAIHPNVPIGTIYNAIARIQKRGVIGKNDDGQWRVLQPEMAGVIKDDFLWAPTTAFLKEELAAHRREAILHVLGHFTMGLQIVQIVEQLRNCTWMKAPVNKDLLKGDIQALLDEHKIKQRGNTRKWGLVTAEKGENKTE